MNPLSPSHLRARWGPKCSACCRRISKTKAFSRTGPPPGRLCCWKHRSPR
nr:MAG TPA_asm: hypothetical protein [Caudoviricetes sp.]